jgi:uncharacterized membrane protein HdeD (DUF308 family)
VPHRAPSRAVLLLGSLALAVGVAAIARPAALDAASWVLLGSIAGLLVEMTAPLLGVVMLLALLPAKLLPLGIASAIGAIAGRAAVTRLGPA